MAENSYRLLYEARKHIRRLGSLSARRRASALARLRELGNDGLVALHEAIDYEKKQWHHRQVSLSCMLLILALPTLVGFRVLFDKDLDSASRTLFTCTGLLLTSLIVVGFMSLRKPSSTYQGQVIALAEIGDTSSISRLIDALDTGDPSARRRAEVAVSVLLPSITFETTSIVGTEQRAILHRHLGGDCVPLIIAILNSMRHFRDASALPMLERLASSEKPAVSRDPAVSKALADVLPLIREIAARNTGRRTLLRASTAGCVIAETALRPITETPDTRDQELLRAGGSHVRE